MNSDNDTGHTLNAETGSAPTGQPPSSGKRSLRTVRLAGVICLVMAAGIAGGAAIGAKAPEHIADATMVTPTAASDIKGGTDGTDAPKQLGVQGTAMAPAPAAPAETTVADIQLAAGGPDIEGAATGSAGEDAITEGPQLAALPPEGDIEEEVPAAPAVETHVLTVSKGDTLMNMLAGIGIDRAVAHDAIAAMSEVFSPRKLRPGHELHVTVQPPGTEGGATSGSFDLVGIRLPETQIREIQVSRLDDGGFAAETLEKATTTRRQRADGVIDTSLYEAALEAGVPLSVLAELITVFSFDIDFQREIQPGDRFSLMFDTVHADGVQVGTGAVQLAEMTVGGKLRRYYRFKGDDGFYDYFDEKGQSVRKALLRTPVDGARLSSRYGKRRHPILGYAKMHRGVDFAAPTGTPVFSAGNGTVEVAGWNGGFGKYIRIRHNGTYQTAYAHLSRIAVKKGARVRQGQVIGYVGSTGRSTGPHLHYEVHFNGKQTNPLGIKLPTGKKLEGKELAAFEAVRDSIDRQYASLMTLETAAGGE